MDPISTARYGSPQGFNPATAPNTVEQQRRQDEEFLRQFKETKELELAQEAQLLNDIKQNNRIERESLAKRGRAQVEQLQQKNKLESNRIQRQYQAEQSATGGMNSKDKRFNDALSLVTSLSKTAISTATKIGQGIKTDSENRAVADANKLIATGVQPGTATPEAIKKATSNIGAGQQTIALETTQLKQMSDATTVGKVGTVEAVDLEAYLKGQNGWYRNTFIKTYAAQQGKDFGRQTLAKLQEQKLQDPNSTISMYGEDVPISSVDLGNPSELEEAIQSSIPGFLKQEGLDGYSDTMLADFYKNVASSTQQTVGTIRSAQIATQKKDIIDNAEGIFRMDATPLNAKMLYTTYTQSGLSAKEARVKMTEQTAVLPQDEFDAIYDAPFGPNGLAFKDQYQGDYAQAKQKRDTYIKQNRNSRQFAQETDNAEFLLDFNDAFIQDAQDGNIDADPETLAAIAQKRESMGDATGAAAVRAKIPMTRNKLYDDRFVEQLKQDGDLGILNYTKQQIADNASLSAAGKQAAMKVIDEYNSKQVPQNIKTQDQGVINAALKNRLKTNMFTEGGDDFSLKIKQKEAWNDYRKVFNAELQNGSTPEKAAEAALNDFYAKYNDKEGTYAVTDPLTGESARFTKVDTAGKRYAPSVNLMEVNRKVELKGEKAAFSEPNLYETETKELQSMLDGIKSTGTVVVPETLRRIQDKMGGTMSLRQLLNQRLGANKLDTIPQEVGKLADEVQSAFDPSYNKFLNYKPNSTRTDIAAIGSGQDPIYEARIPANLKDDVEFTTAVTKTAQDLGISESALYAVMDFETGGSFNPGTRNAAGSGATGLIQFMPATAKDLGTTTEALSKMSRAQQMKYVSYYLQNKVKPGMGAADVYMSVLFPAAVGKPDDFVLFGNGAMSGYTGISYDQNAGLDLNKDGRITKAEAAAKVVGAEQTWRQPRNMRPELMEAR